MSRNLTAAAPKGYAGHERGTLEEVMHSLLDGPADVTEDWLMARYKVSIDVAHGPRLVRTVRARSPHAAYQAVRRGLIGAGVEPDARHLSTVSRRRLLRRSLMLLGSWGRRGDGDDGTAGVREPRRPKPAPQPAPPSLRLALAEPRENSPAV